MRVNRGNTSLIGTLSVLLSVGQQARAAEPRVLIDGHRLELVASEPEIVTPIGLSFDRQGRLLVVESHTHQRREDYEGPTTDRIRMLSDSDGDGRLDRWKTYAEGFRPALNVLARADGGVYVVTRGQVLLLHDSDGDGAADQRSEILRLETTADYPHNGLSGIAIDPVLQELIVGLGENFGAPYRFVGSDGAAIEGRGGKSGVFRCSLDGKGLRRIATGFWNPFAVCVAPHGRIFAVDNDPDASPPCRLIHVVPGGDYGYLYQYGRSGLHPLQAWDGQLPGALPMVAGTGEAPTAIVAHRGRLWVTSWGEHSVESYKLIPQGASFTATREIVVQGAADFRPTGMAVAPDGSIYFGDWRRRDYPVHGTGRIWRLSFPNAEQSESFPDATEGERKAAALREGEGAFEFETTEPFLEAAAAYGLATHAPGTEYSAQSAVAGSAGGDSTPPDWLRLRRLAALRQRQPDTTDAVLRAALADDSPAVRLFALRWITDERRTSLAGDVARLLDRPMADERYYLAVLAAVDWLNSPPRQRNTRYSDGLLVRELRNASRGPEVHALALSLVSPNNPFLTIEQLQRYLQSEHAPLQLAAVRALALQSRPERFDLLAEIARNSVYGDRLRAEAVMGLAAAAERFHPLLDELANGNNEMLRREADRVLKLAGHTTVSNEAKPAANDLAAWLALVEQPGDAAAGRRLFFSAVGSRCAICHQHGGQGGTIGPDLTHIGGRVSRERLLASILQPSQEIAPRYQPWVLVTRDGKTYSGLRLSESGDDGSEEYVDSAGREFQLASEAIESRAPSATSIMPDSLEKLLSIDEFRDLITFLTTAASAAN
jgi:putative membrane-bound dehydrogenase-like protein